MAVINENNKTKAKTHWHTDDQHAFSQNKVYRRTVRNRINFIVCAITYYLTLLKNIPDSVKILDAGCGDGVILKALCEISGCLVVGCDYNGLRLARSKLNCPKALLVNGELSNIPLKGETFDIIVLNQVLEHIHNDFEVLGAVRRLMRKNGILILGIPNEGSFLGSLRNNFIQRKIRRETDHKHFYTEKTILEKLRQSGFIASITRHDGFMFPHIWINDFMASSDWGFNFTQSLGKLFKTQCAGLYCVCRKTGQN